MRLKEIYEKKNVCHNRAFEWVKPVISFEVFPPKSNTGGFYGELNKLKEYEPAFISLTYGAAGKNNTSLEVLYRIKNELRMDLMAHLTCAGSSRGNIEEWLGEIELLGAENVLALRGDIPEDCSPGDFRYASELIRFIKEKTDLSVGAAGYPEGHIECPDLFADIANLKKKTDAGADVIYTQLFFDNDKFFSYVQLVRDAGIEVPIIPGIMPVISKKQIERITSMAKISVPGALLNRIEKFKDNPSDMLKLGIDFAVIQCQQLIDAEVSGLHFYTLNKAYSTAQILDNIMGVPNGAE
ncbi:MAG: methylenetetrahydrofolate reductase [Heliobacteriaceae bacterium]|jgi:methylenetetrahydrofolate reductase (NADPH)|nr:methylenetetrahydrofolate reductase [Heliobacteriaceae bacterium]